MILIDYYPTLQIKLKKIDKSLSIYYTWKNIKKSTRNNKLKISAPKWNEEFKLTVRTFFCIRYSRYSSKNLSNRYSQGMLSMPQKLLNRAKKSTTDALKSDSKRAIQKTAESTSDLVSNKTANKITSISKI